ncbi:sensor histidine kinase [Streptomyces sp. NPDC041068]|uniref:sensor histidine kinase n=1 Tax=Streptomyces sp. NPDC041068 TaxID=3155130 RepID=UPI0033E085CD
MGRGGDEGSGRGGGKGLGRGGDEGSGRGGGKGFGRGGGKGFGRVGEKGFGRVGEKGFGSFVLSGLRAVRDDLVTWRAMPLPPLAKPRLLRWLPHLVVVLLGIATFFGNLDQFPQRYGLGFGLGVPLAIGQSVALVLALWRPAPAWWLSLVSTVVAALCSAGRIIAEGPPEAWPQGSPESWPWAGPGLVAHAVITLLLALRLPATGAVAAFVLSAGLLPLLHGWRAPDSYDNTMPVAVFLFGTLTLIGIALRGRREARTRLVEQETLTAEERARRTLLEERSRIARELHDVVAHHMSVISIQAQVAPHLVKDPPEELKENLAGIRENALEALAELRRVLGVLRSENPEDPEAAPRSPLPTLERLGGLVDNARAAGLTVRCETAGEVRPLPPGVDLSAYRIVQEALSNAIRHAPGSTVRIDLAHTRSGLRVRVTNTGTHIKAPPSPGAGHGLLGMRERTAMLGGDLATGPTPDGGYEVSAFLPTNQPPTNQPPTNQPPTNQPPTNGESTP